MFCLLKVRESTTAQQKYNHYCLIDAITKTKDISRKYENDKSKKLYMNKNLLKDTQSKTHPNIPNATFEHQNLA